LLPRLLNLDYIMTFDHEEMQYFWLHELLELAVTKYRLAKNLGVSQQVVQGWFLRGRISATAAIKAESVYGIKKEDLRPDVINWGE
jgi:DNA-binding transcriptional regulator YdaS (Cro superfamily)